MRHLQRCQYQESVFPGYSVQLFQHLLYSPDLGLDRLLVVPEGEKGAGRPNVDENSTKKTWTGSIRTTTATVFRQRFEYC
jgi:hypothetical protein